MGYRATENLNSPYYEQLKNGFAGLRFSDFVEEEFLSQFAQASVMRSRLMLILVLGVTLISIGAVLSGSDENPVILLFDFFVMLPVLGFALLISMNPSRHHLYRFLLSVSAMLIGMWATSIAVRASLNGMPYYFSILITWTFVVWFILGLPFRFAAVTSVSIAGLYIFGSVAWELAFNEAVFTIATLVFANGVCIIGCYQLEHARRRSFLDSRVLARLAERDGLTGLYNRRSYDQYVERIWRQSRREEVQLTLILVDIDHFKAFNDRYGHQAGDDALKAVANVIAHGAQRPLDFAARYGGEEFALILYGPDDQFGRERAEQLRESVRDLKIPHVDSEADQYLTISVGVALILPGSARSMTGAIQMADEALYQAKEGGRNRVIVKASDSHIQTGKFRQDKAANA